MSLIRTALFALAATVAVPTVSHAADDDVCVAWVHVFVDAEVDPKTDTVTIRSEDTCLAYLGSIVELPLPPDGKPHHGTVADWTVEQECKGLERTIAEMERALRQAQAALPAAQAALEAAKGADAPERAAYDRARLVWARTDRALVAARQAFEQVHPAVVEVERDGEGRVQRVAREFDTSDAVGQALADAVEAERVARAAMDAAWAAWQAAGTFDDVLAAQARVDQLTTVIDTYPAALEAARAEAAALGC